MAIQYGFYPDESSMRRELNGAPGLILCAIFGLCFAYWTVRAGWRFFSDGKAAVLTERGVLLHRLRPSCSPQAQCNRQHKALLSNASGTPYRHCS